MTTTLKSFQAEIEEINSRETIKHRQQVIAAREKENEYKLPRKGGKQSNPSAPTDIQAPIPQNKVDSAEVEEQIQASLLNGDRNEARDLIATMLTQHRGEFLIRIGKHPSHAQLFSGEPIPDDPGDGWYGTPRSQEEMELIRAGLESVVDEVGGKTSILCQSPHRMTLLFRLPSLNVSLTPEVRCAVVGNVDSGKSTTLGVLTRGTLDDGRGKARVWLFRHAHERETGRTSSVGMEILGFDTSGKAILPNAAHMNDTNVIRRERLGWEDISMRSAKIVTFSDLAGHERYLKTTLYGLTSGAPSCVILMVGANAGLIGMSKEHLAIALALSVPVVVCITKIDMTPPNVMAETLKQVIKILKSPGCRKTPVLVKTIESAVEIAQSFSKEKLCPIFQISNVTGEGLDYVRTFLNLLPSSEADAERFAVDQPLEYSVTEVYSVPYVGTVVSGILLSGRVSTGEHILLGPDSNGNFLATIIKDMQRKRVTVSTAEAGQCVSFALKRVRKGAVRKGMVILSKGERDVVPPPKATRKFEGQVLILYHNTTVQKNYQAMLHCGAVRQTVRILSIDHPQQVLRTGDRATVQFEFISHPEFIKKGMKLLFREGNTKGLGVITELL